MAEHEDAIDLERLDHWQPAAAPAGFADKVVARWQHERAAVRERGSRRRRWAALGTAVIAAALLVGWAVGRDDVVATSGSLLASSQRTVGPGAGFLAGTPDCKALLGSVVARSRCVVAGSAFAPTMLRNARSIVTATPRSRRLIRRWCAVSLARRGV